MSDKSEVKPARPASARKPRAKSDTPAADADDAFGAGIVDEAPTAAEPPPEPDPPAPTAAEPPARRPAPPRAEPEAEDRPKPRPVAVDPNEHGVDAETNSRYEEIKRGNTYITELQHMTIAQLQAAAKA